MMQDTTEQTTVTTDSEGNEQYQYTEIDHPSEEKKDSIFRFFREILNKPDSSKVGNLDNPELGMLNHTVRRYQDVALFNQKMKQDKVAEWLNARAEIILATSLSKKGFFVQTLVTNIKKNIQPTHTEKTKKGLLSFLKGQSQEQEGETQ